jgi:hypothetical protein
MGRIGVVSAQTGAQKSSILKGWFGEPFRVAIGFAIADIDKPASCKNWQ